MTDAKDLGKLRLREFFDWEGRLAQYRGGYVLKERPATVHRIAVATTLKAEDHSRILGSIPWSLTNTWSGQVSSGMGGYVTVRCDDWPTCQIETPYPKPRDGKEFGWEWKGDFYFWQKEYYPRCGECYGYHDPALSHCNECGKASKAVQHHQGQDRCAACRKAVAS